MSFAGFVVFEKNVRIVMESKAFKEGAFSVKAELGYRLFRSRYGTIGCPKELEVEKISDEQRR